MMIDPFSIWVVSAIAILLSFLVRKKERLAVSLLLIGLLGMVPLLLEAFETPRPWVRVRNSSDQPVTNLSVSFSPTGVQLGGLASGGEWGARIFPEKGAEVVIAYRDAMGVDHTHKARLDENMLFLIPELEIQKDLMVSWGKGVVASE
jgi:hypothetical protein